MQAFPQDSYNQSVVAAAASKKLPCILDIDGPNVPNWAWAGYLAPLEGMDDTLVQVPAVGAGQVERQDLLLRLLRRGAGDGDPQVDPGQVRHPDPDHRPAVDQGRARGGAGPRSRIAATSTTRSTSATSATGEWWPYAYSPFLQSFGGDLINRDGYKTAEGVLNGPQAIEWAAWLRGLITERRRAAEVGHRPGQGLHQRQVRDPLQRHLDRRGHPEEVR